MYITWSCVLVSFLINLWLVLEIKKRILICMVSVRVNLVKVLNLYSIQITETRLGRLIIEMLKPVSMMKMVFSIQRHVLQFQKLPRTGDCISGKSTTPVTMTRSFYPFNQPAPAQNRSSYFIMCFLRSAKLSSINHSEELDHFWAVRYKLNNV